MEVNKKEYLEFLEWKKQQPKKIWKPKDKERYYFITSEGDIDNELWLDSFVDDVRYSIGNCFETQEEAEFMIEKLKVIAELKRFAEEHNDFIDWENEKQEKWTLMYYHRHEGTLMYVDAYYYVEHVNDIYFSSEELCKQAIEEVGEDRIKKYYLGVK